MLIPDPTTRENLSRIPRSKKHRILNTDFNLPLKKYLDLEQNDMAVQGYFET
jgi:hypothetical protein